MNTRSFLRLRLERLETRSLLSAIAMPLLPPAVLPPVPAVLSELHAIDRHSPAQVVTSDAVQDGAAMPGANPASTPVQSGVSFFMPAQSGDHSADTAVTLDLHRAADLKDEGPFSPISALASANPRLDVPDQQAELGSPPAIQEPVETSQAVTVNHANLQIGAAVATDPIEASVLSPNLEVPRHDSLILQDTVGQQDASHSFEIHTPPSIRLAEDLAPVAPVAVDATILAHGIDEGGSLTEAVPPNRGPALFQVPMTRPADLPAQDMAANDVIFAIEISMPIRAHASDMSAGYEPNRAGDPSWGTAETGLPPYNGGPSLPATPPATVSESTNSNPGEGGFISLDDAPAATAQFGNVSPTSAGINGLDFPQASPPIHNQTTASAGIIGVDLPQAPLPINQGQVSPSTAGLNGLDFPQMPLATNQSPASSSSAGLNGIDFPQMPLPGGRNQTPSNSAGFTGVGGAQLDFGNWLTDIRPNLNKPADSNSLNRAGRSGEKAAAEIPSRPAPLVSQSVADSQEGGSIELAIASPATTGVASPVGDDASDGNAAQQLSDIRPESGVGLFCDIEVAVSPGLPIVGSAATGISDQNPGVLSAGRSANAASLHSSAEFAPPLTDVPHPTLAGLIENLPLLLGVTILVSRGGLRLEEEVPARERSLRVIEKLGLS